MLPTHGDPPAPSLSASDDGQRMLKRRIAFLLSLAENKYCVDCCRPSPRWVSLVVVDPNLLGSDYRELRSKESRDKPSLLKRSLSTIGTKTTSSMDSESEPLLPLGCFCCLECSGAHRRLGTHISFVRSVDLDSFKEREVQALEFAGNATVNGVLEAKLLHTSQDCETGAIRVSFRIHDREIIKRCGGNTAWNNNSKEDRLSREAFIRDKYDKKLFIDYSALRRVYLFPTSTNKSPAGCIVYTVPESPQASTASESESVCEASVPSSSSDLQLKLFTSSPKTMETVHRYIRETTTPSSGSVVKESSTIQDKRVPPRHTNSGHQNSSNGSSPNNILDDLMNDDRNTQLYSKNSDIRSPQSLSIRTADKKATSAQHGNSMRQSGKQSDNNGNNRGHEQDHDESDSPLLDTSMIVSIDYDESSAYEVVYQGNDDIVTGRWDIPNNHGKTTELVDRGSKRSEASTPLRKDSKNQTTSIPPKIEAREQEKARSNSQLRMARNKNDDAKEANDQKLGSRSSSRMRRKKESEARQIDALIRPEAESTAKQSGSGRKKNQSRQLDASIRSEADVVDSTKKQTGSGFSRSFFLFRTSNSHVPVTDDPSR